MMKKAMPVPQKSNPKIYLGQMCHVILKIEVLVYLTVLDFLTLYFLL